MAGRSVNPYNPGQTENSKYSGVAPTGKSSGPTPRADDNSFIPPEGLPLSSDNISFNWDFMDPDYVTMLQQDFDMTSAHGLTMWNTFFYGVPYDPTETVYIDGAGNVVDDPMIPNPAYRPAEDDTQVENPAWVKWNQKTDQDGNHTGGPEPPRYILEPGTPGQGEEFIIDPTLHQTTMGSGDVAGTPEYNWDEVPSEFKNMILGVEGDEEIIPATTVDTLAGLSESTTGSNLNTLVNTADINLLNYGVAYDPTEEVLLDQTGNEITPEEADAISDAGGKTIHTTQGELNGYDPDAQVSGNGLSEIELAVLVQGGVNTLDSLRADAALLPEETKTRLLNELDAQGISSVSIMNNNYAMYGTPYNPNEQVWVDDAGNVTTTDPGTGATPTTRGEVNGYYDAVGAGGDGAPVGTVGLQHQVDVGDLKNKLAQQGYDALEIENLTRILTYAIENQLGEAEIDAQLAQFGLDKTRSDYLKSLVNYRDTTGVDRAGIDLEKSVIDYDSTGITEQTPVRKALYDQALEGLDTEKYARQAGSEASMAYDASKEGQYNQAARRGLDPSTMNLDDSIQRSSVIAGAKTGARNWAEQESFNRLSTALNTNTGLDMTYNVNANTGL